MVNNSGTSALISGGTKGLGMAVAECLIRQGCTKLTITGRNADCGEAAAAQLRDTGADCLFVACNAANTADCEAAVAAAIAHQGHVNALVNPPPTHRAAALPIPRGNSSTDIWRLMSAVHSS